MNRKVPIPSLLVTHKDPFLLSILCKVSNVSGRGAEASIPEINAHVDADKCQLGPMFKKVSQMSRIYMFSYPLFFTSTREIGRYENSITYNDVKQQIEKQIVN